MASSDSASDQAAKLRARDAVLKEARALLHGCESAEQAFAIVKEEADRLAECAEKASGQTARAETGVFDFPDRRYGNTVVPAGAYWALRIVLGEGRGHNWWCVLYPGMCVPEDVSDEPIWKRILAHWCAWRGK